MLISLIKTRPQWTEYMEAIISLVSTKRKRNGGSISTSDYATYPFRAADVPLSEYNNVLV